MYSTVFTVEDTLVTFTQAASSPVAPSKNSISWLSLVRPSEEVKTMSSPSFWALAASSQSNGRLTASGWSGRPSPGWPMAIVAVNRTAPTLFR
jgi:hypothetical protein